VDGQIEIKLTRMAYCASNEDTRAIIGGLNN